MGTTWAMYFHYILDCCLNVFPLHFRLLRAMHFPSLLQIILETDKKNKN